jgi:hypothetical protein
VPFPPQYRESEKRRRNEWFRRKIAPPSPSLGLYKTLRGMGVRGTQRGSEEHGKSRGWPILISKWGHIIPGKFPYYSYAFDIVIGKASHSGIGENRVIVNSQDQQTKQLKWRHHSMRSIKLTRNKEYTTIQHPLLFALHGQLPTWACAVCGMVPHNTC